MTNNQANRSCRPLALVLCCSLLWACEDNADETVVVTESQPPEPEIILLQQESIALPSAAQPAHTPGSPSVVVTNERLINHFGSPDVNLNNALYTRYFLSNQATMQPDAILVLIPGFEGGASNYLVLADNLLRRAQQEKSLSLEVWAIDRRSNQLEDTVGLDIAEDTGDLTLGLDFLFGEQLGLSLIEAAMDGPGRRAVFYNTDEDTAFMAQWTTLVHSQDIDAIVQAARATAHNGNVFMGGHSAGTGYAARYAATDFDLDSEAEMPGYKNLRGLILFEGGGGSVSGLPVDEATLDMIEAKFDGGLHGAVRDQAPRCVDGVTACKESTATTDCAAFSNPVCVTPVKAYADGGGLLSPQLLAVSEISALDIELHGDGQPSILQFDHNNEAGNNAFQRVPQLAALGVFLGTAPASSLNLLGQFLDDDGLIAQIASFVATSVGFAGPEVDGVKTWSGYGEELPIEATPDNGPAPETIATRGRWGQEAEPSDLAHMLPMFYRGKTNFSDWYYPSSGLSVTQGLSLDTTALSAPPPLGRGRHDIENRTQAHKIDLPVIAFGGSNGLTPTPSSWLGFAAAIAPCGAPSCDGVTNRLVSATMPSEAFPSFGDVSGGFEVYIAEGYAHLDVLTAEDDDSNNIVAPLLEFVARNQQ